MRYASERTQTSTNLDIEHRLNALENQVSMLENPPTKDMYLYINAWRDMYALP